VTKFESLKVLNCYCSVIRINCLQIIFFDSFCMTDVRVGPEMVTDPAFLVTR